MPHDEYENYRGELLAESRSYAEQFAGTLAATNYLPETIGRMAFLDGADYARKHPWPSPGPEKIITVRIAQAAANWERRAGRPPALIGMCAETLKKIAGEFGMDDDEEEWRTPGAQIHGIMIEIDESLPVYMIRFEGAE